MKNVKLGFLQDSDGNKSAKRLWGAVLLGVGVLLSLILFYYSTELYASDAETAIGIINSLLLSGSGLLGIGVFERIKK